MAKIDLAATILIVLGALNWGFIGVFRVDLIDLFFENNTVDRCIYLLIGAAALFKIIYFITGRWRLSFEEDD